MKVSVQRPLLCSVYIHLEGTGVGNRGFQIQVGMNVSWSQLGSIGEFVVFAVNGTSGRGHGREKEWNSCGSAIELGMAVPCHHWPDMLQFLDSPVTDVTF
ncbi:hypothetical protein CSKR_105472 [Clonorchis sinensis]|uniref:Uncharacterized protein n=1 Tax=Clonorchis sinensis TaxID=79923 RepID=A0A3R7CX54_CLOSI|nr:hypothetical protein CSKR_105472 [Clonorchis sinensis]